MKGTQDAGKGDRYDVVVIGAGPAGEAAAVLGGNLGYSVALVERDVVGGTVLTSGGAPTKTYRETALYFSSFEKDKVYRVALSAPPEVTYPALRARAREVSERMMQESLARIRSSGVRLVHGTARLEDDHAVEVEAGDESIRLYAERVIIATGSRPLRPATVPFDDPWVFDSETIASITSKPDELLIIGGGAIGVEYATIFSALDVHVTIVDNGPRLVPMMDGEICQRLAAVFQARGNQLILGTSMTSVTRDGDVLAVGLADGRRLRPNALLFAAGRSVSTTDLGLENVGVEIDARGRIVVDASRRTSCPWVFAAGDVIGPSLASVATDQGREALCGALGLDFSVHVDQVSTAAVYALPEVARVGKSEEDCEAEGIEYVVGRCELGRTPRGIIAGQQGLLKLLFRQDNGVLIGVHAICDIASEILGTGQAMLHNAATIEDTLRMTYNVPTYTYGYKLAATDVLTRMRPDALRAMHLPSTADKI